MARSATTPTTPQGQRLRLIITQQRLGTLTALAAATGVQPSRLSQANNGARPLGPLLCGRIAARFGYRPAWLLTGEGPPRPHQPGGPEWRRAQADRLALVQQETGLNGQELAHHLGVSAKTLAGAHSGRTGISVRLARALETRFGYRAVWLRDGEGAPLADPAQPAAERPAERARLEREATVTADVFALLERHAPAYLTAAERLTLTHQLAARVLHPRSFLPAPPKRPRNEGVTIAEGVPNSAG